MIKNIAKFFMPLAVVLLPELTVAGSNSHWYTTPEQKGSCGEECYSAPAAWIDDASGDYSFAVSCDGWMYMGGSAMHVSEPPFSQAELYIDSKSYGWFAMHNGLNDTIVSPTNPGRQTQSRIQSALNSGDSLRFYVSNYGNINFKLSGSRAAISWMNTACNRRN